MKNQSCLKQIISTQKVVRKTENNDKSDCASVSPTNYNNLNEILKEGENKLQIEETKEEYDEANHYMIKKKCTEKHLLGGGIYKEVPFNQNVQNLNVPASSSEEFLRRNSTYDYSNPNGFIDLVESNNKKSSIKSVLLQEGIKNKKDECKETFILKRMKHKLNNNDNGCMLPNHYPGNSPMDHLKKVENSINEKDVYILESGYKGMLQETNLHKSIINKIKIKRDESVHNKNNDLYDNDIKVVDILDQTKTLEENTKDSYKNGKFSNEETTSNIHFKLHQNTQMHNINNYNKMNDKDNDNKNKNNNSTNINIKTTNNNVNNPKKLDEIININKKKKENFDNSFQKSLNKCEGLVGAFSDIHKNVIQEIFKNSNCRNIQNSQNRINAEMVKNSEIRMNTPHDNISNNLKVKNSSILGTTSSYFMPTSGGVESQINYIKPEEDPKQSTFFTNRNNELHKNENLFGVSNNRIEGKDYSMKEPISINIETKNDNRNHNDKSKGRKLNEQDSQRKEKKPRIEKPIRFYNPRNCDTTINQDIKNNLCINFHTGKSLNQPNSNKYPSITNSVGGYIFKRFKGSYKRSCIKNYEKLEYIENREKAFVLLLYSDAYKCFFCTDSDFTNICLRKDNLNEYCIRCIKLFKLLNSHATRFNGMLLDMKFDGPTILDALFIYKCDRNHLFTISLFHIIHFLWCPHEICLYGNINWRSSNVNNINHNHVIKRNCKYYGTEFLRLKELDSMSKQKELFQEARIFNSLNSSKLRNHEKENSYNVGEIDLTENIMKNAGNPWEVLQISHLRKLKNSDKTQIKKEAKKSFRKLALKVHPDKNKSNKASAAMSILYDSLNAIMSLK